MHQFIIKCFDLIKSFLQFIRILLVLFILIILLYWIQNLTDANWAWLGLFKPFLDAILEFSNGISSFSVDLFGALFEIKYFIAVLIFIILGYLDQLCIMLVDFLESVYRKTRMFIKKTDETILNKELEMNVKFQEKMINKYSIIIKTRVKPNNQKLGQVIDINEQNDILNKFISEQLGVHPLKLNDYFLYNFNSIESVDSTLDVLFKVLESRAPIDYLICIQAGENLAQLAKVSELGYWNKITVAADTAYRYSHNSKQRYLTSQVGTFQTGNGTLEIHEFQKKLN